jgi:regulatory protein
MAKSGELNTERLRSLALHYVGRFATTQGKLAAYLTRKVRERGWQDDEPPAISDVVERMAELRYVDDAAFAEGKAAALKRRGLGSYRISATLAQAGISRDLAQENSAMDRDEAYAVAIAFARRKRIGPFAPNAPDKALYGRWIASMMRAGHKGDIAHLVLKQQAADLAED